jgi:hypothetical protein
MDSMARKPNRHCNIVGGLEAILAWMLLGLLVVGAYLTVHEMGIWMALKFMGGEG